MAYTVSSSLERACINTIRLLSAEMVQKAKSGHPGAPMGLAPLAFILFTQHMNMNPLNSTWIARDRFVLSNGHACALQYVMLHLLGYKVSMNDLKSFRQLDSNTPGHPEAHMTDGVEVTTGPLGQGIANAVGLAIAEAQLAATFNKPGFKLFDNYTFCIVGDGCLQEGIASEAMSLAGHLKLSKLIVIYDDNKIQIDGETNLAFTENVAQRMQSYGFEVLYIDQADTDTHAIYKAIETAKTIIDKPVFVQVRTTIGFGSSKQGTEKVHGSPLGDTDIVALKKQFGFDPEAHFVIPEEVQNYFDALKLTSSAKEAAWQSLFQAYRQAFPDLASELIRRLEKKIPEGLLACLPTYKPTDAPVATRKLSENVLNAIADKLPELIGGSADLTASNLTRWKTATDFQPSVQLGNYGGRYIRFGVREHAMAGICNGLAAYGLFIPFGATFLNFITYAWGSVRLSALSHFQVIYIMTHDSIGLGEDGPTHQPVETFAALRALPNIMNWRPADGNEVSGAYFAALTCRNKPSVLALSRQNLPHLQGSSIEATLKGAYILSQVASPDAVLVGTGSEVSILVDAARELAKQNVTVNVVSMPCWEAFESQPEAYKAQVFPEGIPIVSLEAMSTFGWSKYAHVNLGMTQFGASAPYTDIYEHLGFTPLKVAENVLKTITFYKSHPLPSLRSRPAF